MRAEGRELSPDGSHDSLLLASFRVIIHGPLSQLVAFDRPVCLLYNGASPSWFFSFCFFGQSPFHSASPSLLCSAACNTAVPSADLASLYISYVCVCLPCCLVSKGRILPSVLPEPRRLTWWVPPSPLALACPSPLTCFPHWATHLCS